VPPDQKVVREPSRGIGLGLGVDESDNLQQFGFKVSRYFLDFLETDFKRQQAPRRRIQIKNDANQITGVPLRKYEALHHAVAALLAKDLAGNGPRALTVPRGRYKVPIDPLLKNLIGQYIDAIETQKFRAIFANLTDTTPAAVLIGRVLDHRLRTPLQARPSADHRG